MKIVLTTVSPDLETDVDPRFGRAANLLVVDTDTLEWKAESNPGASASGGAGIRAAQFVADQHAQAAISGDFGPHAFEALQAAGIAMYVYGDCQNAQQAIECFKAGQLQQVGGPTRGECDSGHHGQSA
ncbi:MAG: hypothetical protein A2Y88_06795 [Chloroflexi bacterium RBG_13_48_10]|nr:MAG: hypothetical protein A2Y88_06795 [Chloroflexi bacterium RBG_13_48_10]